MQGGGAVQGRELALALCARPHPPHLPSPVHVPRHTNSSYVHAGHHHHHHYIQNHPPRHHYHPDDIINDDCPGCRATTIGAHPLYHWPAFILP